MLTLRTLFLSLHVSGGVLGLLLGAFALRAPQAPQARLLIRRGYFAALVLLVVFLVATVAVDWPGLAAAQRVIFVVLAGLGVFMVTRAYLSFRVASRQPPSWPAAYMNHVYFTYISLWEGLFIVSLFDLGAPPPLIAVVAVGLVIVGAILFNVYKGRVLDGRQLVT